MYAMATAELVRLFKAYLAAAIQKGSLAAACTTKSLGGFLRDLVIYYSNI
jgi:hypothetical protein